MTNPYVTYLISEVRASKMCVESSAKKLGEIKHILLVLFMGMKSVGPEQMQELIHSIFSEEQWLQITLCLPLVWDSHFNKMGLLMVFPPTMSVEVLELELERGRDLFHRGSFKLAEMSLEELRAKEPQQGWEGMLLKAWMHFREKGPSSGTIPVSALQ